MQNKKEEKQTISQETNNPETTLITHECGLTYKEYPVVIGDGKGGTIDVKIRLFNSINPGKVADETFAEYKFRQRFMNKQIKKYLKGTTIWDSSTKGTLTMAKALEEHAKYMESNGVK